MIGRHVVISLLVVLAAGMLAQPAISLTEGCKRNPNYCQSLELCAIIGNGKYSDRYPAYARRLADMGMRCVPDLTPRGHSKRAANPTQPISILQAGFSKLPALDRKSIQFFLKEEGYYTSTVDGLFGTKTKNALDAYLRETKRSKPSKVSEVESFLSELIALAAVKSQQGSNTNDATALSPDLALVGFGTGFFVSQEGYVVTNNHVVYGCSKVTTKINGVEMKAVLISSDPLNDLALLKFKTSPDHVFALSEASPYPLQEVVVVGYPFGDQISSTAKFTRGVVSSLAGIANNFSQLQVDAAMQPGNSGGPILDEHGNVLAVAVSKLSLKGTLESYGVIPENTNFGIKGSILRNLLESNAIETVEAIENTPTPKELGETASRGVVLLACWKPRKG